MRHPDDRSTGGDLLIYKFKKTRQYNDIHGVSVDDGDAEHVATVPYEANRLILFLNTPDSLHGVSVRSVLHPLHGVISILWWSLKCHCLT